MKQNDNREEPLNDLLRTGELQTIAFLSEMVRLLRDVKTSDELSDLITRTALKILKIFNRQKLQDKIAKLQSELTQLREERNELRSVLSDLVQLKDWKDKYGKDEHYLNAQPGAWESARKAIGLPLPTFQQ